MQACEAGAIPVTHALARGLVINCLFVCLFLFLQMLFLQVHQILDHFEQTCDLQTVAVMSRVLLSSARRANAPPPSSVVSSALERATKSLRSKTLVSASGGVTIEQLQPQQQEQQQLQSQEQQQSQQVQQVQQQEQQQQQEIAQQQQQQEKQQQQQQQEKQDKQHYEKSQQDKQHHVQDKVWTKRLFQKSKARQRASSEAEQPPQMLFAPASISSYLVSSPPAPPVGEREIVFAFVF
jgi:septal ring factor EnvC (AmiA/AmiB activator)